MLTNKFCINRKNVAMNIYLEFMKKYFERNREKKVFQACAW